MPISTPTRCFSTLTWCVGLTSDIQMEPREKHQNLQDLRLSCAGGCLSVERSPNIRREVALSKGSILFVERSHTIRPKVPPCSVERRQGYL